MSRETYLTKDEESVGAVRRQRACAACIPDPGSQDETNGANLALRQKDCCKRSGKRHRITGKPTALLKPYRDTTQGVKAAPGIYVQAVMFPNQLTRSKLMWNTCEAGKTSMSFRRSARHQLTHLGPLLDRTRAAPCHQ